MSIGQTIFNNLKQKYKKPDKPFRICFCPYKESMFDCMESVWEEAFADTEETVTTIVPLPYFEKKQGIPYEIKHEFSNYYRKQFPLALNNGWDCIIIHNPYDLYNRLTQTILFSNHLKNFCDNLVYIPYFVPYKLPLGDTYINTAGAKNSDLIIVDSEETKANYDSVLKLHDRNHIEGKVVAWGSPKLDSVNKNNKYIPVEWTEKIENRKVVLLQTSLNPFYANPDGKIRSIAEYIDHFAQDENTTLIWRPHPLFEITLQDYPAHNEIYQKLKKRLQESNKDIFDNTSDYKTAFNVANRMISDPSSLITVWKATGKPITIIE